jgi:hypothetical protein
MIGLYRAFQVLLTGFEMAILGLKSSWERCLRKELPLYLVWNMGVFIDSIEKINVSLKMF